MQSAAQPPTHLERAPDAGADAEQLVTVLDAAAHEVTQPQALIEPAWLPWRVLVASTDPAERMYLRACLALAKLVRVDEAVTTGQALAAFRARVYSLVFVNDDAADICAETVAAAYRRCSPQGSLVVTSSQSLPQRPAGWWGRWQQWMARQRGGVDIHRRVAKPLNPANVQDVLQVWGRDRLR